MMKIRLTVVLLSALLLPACDGSDSKPAPDPRQQQEILSVKQLIYPYDRTVTLGGILDNRSECTETEWDTLTDDKGRELVRFRCHYNTSAVSNHINTWLEKRYNTLINEYTQRFNTLGSPEYIKSRTDYEERDVATAEESLAKIKALSQHDWSALRDDVSITGPAAEYDNTTGNLKDAGRKITLSNGVMSGRITESLSEEQRNLITQWNRITESNNMGSLPDYWFRDPSGITKEFSQELASRKAELNQKRQKLQDESNKNKAVLSQVLSALKDAQQESKDWQITQELYWSVTGPDPVFMGGMFLVDDRNGQYELKRYLSGLGTISNDNDILTHIYRDITGSAPYMSTVADGLFRHQTSHISLPK
ncbi:hypothetical protein ACVGA5_003141 [Morganella morganii]